MSMLGSPIASAFLASNFMKQSEAVALISPPNDSVTCLSFSPATQKQTYLIAGSWDHSVRCWGIKENGESVPIAMQSMRGPVLDVDWVDDGTKVFMAGFDNTAKCWDLQSNQTMQVAVHEGPIKACHWIKAPNYSVLMTGSYDKTLKFWDGRQKEPVLKLNLPERCFAADVKFPYAVVSPANYGKTLVYKLDNGPREDRQIDNHFDGRLEQRRCISLLKDQSGTTPCGFASGTTNGHGIIQYFSQNISLKETDFTFKCHRTPVQNKPNDMDIFAVNDLKVHPVHHNTLSTVGSDGTFGFWDKKERTTLKKSEQLGQSLTASDFNHNGNVFAYALGYDWSKGHEFNDPLKKKTEIFIRSCVEETKPRSTW